MYEEIIGLNQRYGIGEYYTPEWLSQLVTKSVYDSWMDEHPEKIPKILDPACGSGTFLTNAIMLLKGKHSACPPQELLNLILENVMGFDINPIAVFTSKANYYLALTTQLSTIKTPITIPVYNADSIKFLREGKALFDIIVISSSRMPSTRKRNQF